MYFWLKRTSKRPRTTCYNRWSKIKTKIPYSFLTTASECYCRVHIRFPLLLERGYSNVIDELCMRAQVPLYSSGAWTSNRLRLETERSQNLCGHDWNAQQVSSIDHNYRTISATFCSFPDISSNNNYFLCLAGFGNSSPQKLRDCRRSCDIHTRK